ncbi:MAG: efflux RND transporter periplasmic adaptor subunit [Candidatus Daviesbacteria bacterium]|nr:efflux RND transporter periplasmic adaptor subunit [Candidatus Daviesbacteria bacterium]
MLKKLVNFIPRIVGWFFKTSWKKKAIITLLILIVGFVAGYKIISGRKDGYVFDTAQKRTITEIVTESGTVATNGSVNIYSPTSGVIGEVFVSNGESINENQVLFTVKSTATSQEKTAAYAAYEAAVAAVKQAENTHREALAIVERVHDDVKNHSKDESFLQKETRTTAEVANDNAYDGLTAARAKLLSAQVAYQATQNSKVVAPVSGTVSNLSAVSGSSVVVNNVLVPTMPVLVISGPGETEIAVSVGESDIDKIKTGQEVEIKLDAIDDRVYKGTLKRFDNNGTITQGVVKFNVYIILTDSDDRIKSGMTADVDIVTNKLTDVLAVPNSAVKPYQKGRAVRKLGGSGKLEFVPVKTGLRGKEFTQIIEGLTEGQKIVVSLTSEKTGRKNLLGF